MKRVIVREYPTADGPISSETIETAYEQSEFSSEETSRMIEMASAMGIDTTELISTVEAADL